MAGKQTSEMTIRLKKGSGNVAFEVVSAGVTVLTMSMPGVSSASAHESVAQDSINFNAGDARVVAHIESGRSLFISIIKNSTTPEVFTFIFGGNVTVTGSSALNIQTATSEWEGVSSNVSFASAKHGTLFHCTGPTVWVQLTPKGKTSTFGALSLQEIGALSDAGGEYTVPIGSPVPQFSIGVFDDSARTRGRPVRLGVPVVSTIPTYGGNLTASEKQIMDLGDPQESRTMYFRIVSSHPIPPSVTPVLRINLPLGLDTVGPAVETVMSRANSDNTLFHASYEFRKEDTVDWVDGFCYLSVYMPMVVTAGLDVGFDISDDGGELGSPDEDSPLDG